MEVLLCLMALLLICGFIGFVFLLGQEKRKLETLEAAIQETEETLSKTDSELNEFKTKLQMTEEKLNKYENIINPEEYIEQLQTQAEEINRKKEAINEQISALLKSKQILEAEVSLLEEKSVLEGFGFYEKKYDFEYLTQYEARLETIQNEQKLMLKNNKAGGCDKEWTVGGSKRDGDKMVKEKLQLMLRAFNGECDSAIAKVKYNNISTMENRIKSSFDKVNKLGRSVECDIKEQYLKLKLDELFLIHEYQEKKQAEKEEQRRIREQMREEERAQKEIEMVLKKSAEEEERYQSALEKARNELADASEKQKSKLEGKIQQLEEMLQKAHEQHERAVSRAQLTKSGHVYVISNIGSFGEEVYKIGMTRRLDPLDRVSELGDASVPFPFDIHAMIYSENAPDLENKLHKKFHFHRVNQINERKEFFSAPLEDIATAAKEIAKQTSTDVEINFTMLAEAIEFRKTQAKLRAKAEASTEVSYVMTAPVTLEPSLTT